MPDQAIIDALSEYLSNEILNRPDREIAADEALLSGGLIDSFSLVDVALFVEERWGVRIEDTDLNKDSFDTLNALAALIEERRG